MVVVKKCFPEIISENEDAYFKHLIGLIESRDELCSMEITKSPKSYHFRIAPSIPIYTEILLQDILKLHNLFSIKLDLSKSIKTSSTIVYDIKL